MALLDRIRSWLGLSPRLKKYFSYTEHPDSAETADAEPSDATSEASDASGATATDDNSVKISDEIDVTEHQDPWEPMPIKKYPWSGARCMRTDTADTTRGTINVRVFYNTTQSRAEMACDYIEGALCESFGQWYDVVVDVSETKVPDAVTGISEWGSWLSSNDVSTVNDCNILIGDVGEVQGGGNIAIAPDRDLDDLSTQCPKIFGNGDGHETIHLILHEVGHCLGLPHAHDTEWLGIEMEGMRTPMEGGYSGDTGPIVHVYHRTITPKRLTIS